MKDNAGRKTHDKDGRKTSLTTYLPLTLLQGFERVVQGFACEWVLRPNINFIFWPPLLITVTLCLSCFLRCSTRGLGVHCWMLAFFTPSYQHLLWTPVHQGFPRTPSVGCGFPYHIWSLTLWKSAGNCSGTQTQLNYIIIQRPHDRPLDLWNRMFNRHQAEITVMQFRGYSVPVHHCSGTMGASPCPIS